MAEGAVPSWRAAAHRSASAEGSRAAESRPTKLKREVRSLLNKISPDNEASIVSQLAALELEGAEDFEIIANLAVEKAISDPFYSEVYARAIGKLSMEYSLLPVRHRGSGADVAGSSDSFSSFGETIVEQCRGTFDKFFGKSQPLDDDNEEELPRLKHRAQAYVRLLGHLYVGRIICADSLQYCINTLLLIPSDQEQQEQPTTRLWPPKAWIECACELLYTVGKDLSRSAQGKAILKAATDSLVDWKELRQQGVDVDDGTQPYVFPPRIHFMIEDVVEASSRGWPSLPGDDKGVPEKSKCKMPPRPLQRFA